MVMGARLGPPLCTYRHTWPYMHRRADRSPSTEFCYSLLNFSNIHRNVSGMQMIHVVLGDWCKKAPGRQGAHQAHKKYGIPHVLLGGPPWNNLSVNNPRNNQHTHRQRGHTDTDPESLPRLCCCGRWWCEAKNAIAAYARRATGRQGADAARRGGGIKPPRRGFPGVCVGGVPPRWSMLAPRQYYTVSTCRLCFTVTFQHQFARPVSPSHLFCTRIENHRETRHMHHSPHLLSR